MSTPLLKVTDLRAGYGRAEVLHGLSLQADKGSVITVIGPNGAGKSTLLNTLMGILPGRGRIEFNGQAIDALTLEERVMAGMALVPEKRELFGSMSVEDNLVLGGYRQMRLGNAQWRDRLADVFDLFPRLKERRAQEAGTLSGGERQMLAVGRALMSRPTLLMLDEPSLGLSPKLTKEIFEIVVRINRERGTTILLVEQNANMALNDADHGYVLENGRIVMEDTCERLREKDDIKEFYLGLKEQGVRADRRWKKKKTWR